jgi:hypothetical protein
MPYDLPKANLYKPVSEWEKGGANPLAGLFKNPNINTAIRGGASIATGGWSEIISQALNIIPSIFQGITGRKQIKMARQIERENPRPETTIADSIQKLVDYAYGQTLKGDVPGGNIIRGEIKGATASGIKAASELGSGSEAYGMLGELAGREQNAFAQQGKDIMASNDRYNGVFMDTLTQKGNEENRVWEWNKARPYLQAAETAQRLNTAGLMNKNSALKNIFGSGAEYLAPDLTSSLLGTRTKNYNGKELSQEEINQIIKELIS